MTLAEQFAETTPTDNIYMPGQRPPLTMEQQRLVAENYALVIKIAGRLKRQYSFLDMDDAIGDGCEGLCDAAQKFAEELGVDFEVYAPYRIKGSIIDGARKFRKTRNSAAVHLISIEKQVEYDDGTKSPFDIADPAPGPEEIVLQEQTVVDIDSSVDDLSDRHRYIVSQRIAGLTFKQIGEAMGVHGTRVMQLHAKAKRALEGKKVEWTEATSNTGDALPASLSPARRKELIHASLGMSVAQSAEVSGLSTQTVKTVRAAIIELTGAGSLAQAISIGIKAEWIPIEQENSNPENINLSPAQLKDLTLVIEGYDGPEIAQMTYRSIDTVKAHRKRVFAKLGVHNINQAVRRAYELGIFPLKTTNADSA